MAEIDLIPQDYRYWLWQRRYLQRLGIAALVFVALSFMLWQGLQYYVASIEKELVVLEQQQNEKRLLQTEISQLGDQNKAVQRRLQLLESLRGGTGPQATLRAIDQALPGDMVWFTELSFERQQVVMPSANLPLPHGALRVDLNGESLALAVIVSVEGQASDHAALSTFVDKLRMQKDVAAVKLLNTSSENGSVIEFALTVHLHADKSGRDDA